MSHITCPKCWSNEHICGYGFAAGGLGSYTLCLGCEEVLERTPDPEAAKENDTSE